MKVLALTFGAVARLGQLSLCLRITSLCCIPTDRESRARVVCLVFVGST